MGNVIGGLFGGKKESKSTTSTGGTQTRRTTGAVQPAFPFSIRGNIASGSFRNGRSNFSLGSDFTQNRRQEALRTFRDIDKSTQGDIQSLRSLENPFIRARVRPTEERVARGLADTERGLARRGLQGTLASNELFRLGEAGGREIADQTALAQRESLDAITVRQNQRAAIASGIQNIGESQLRQALAELGFGLESVNTFLRSRAQASGDFTTTGEDTGQSDTRGKSSGDFTGLGNLLFAGAQLF